MQCKWFTEEEKYVAEQRMLRDGSTKTNEKFDLKTALLNLADWRIAVYALIGLSYGIAAASVGNFLPQMVQRLVRDFGGREGPTRKERKKQS